jgi:hypothetical protein
MNADKCRQEILTLIDNYLAGTTGAARTAESALRLSLARGLKDPPKTIAMPQ